MDKHTPTPLFQMPRTLTELQHLIADPVYGEMILRAVNAHEELIRLMHTLVAYAPTEAVKQRALKAIAKAEGK